MKKTWILALLLVSCSTEPIVHEDREQIIIERNNDTTYAYTNLNDLHMGYIDRQNGDVYDFRFDDGIELKSNEQMVRVKFYKNPQDKGKELMVINNRVKVLDKEGIFRIWK